jgi:ketosteroid isomerase-like protein
MSEENVEVVRRLFAAFQAAWDRDDPGAMFDSGAVAADAEWIPFRGFPGPQSYRGRDGFIEFWRTWTEDFEDWSVALERLVDAGDDRVVVLLHQTATGKESGVPVELHFGQVHDLEAGRVVRMRNYDDPAEALEAAGLSE